MLAFFTPTFWAQNVPVYTAPDAIAARVGGIEDVSKRTRSARHFRNANSSWTAVIGRNLNAPDQSGKLTPVTRQLSQSASGWLMNAGALTVNVARTGSGHDVQHAYTTASGSKHVVTLSFPNVAWQKETTFGFSLAGQSWSVNLDEDSTSFSTVVKSRQGAQSYIFPFDGHGLKASVNAQGDVVFDDATSLTRATMIRADGQAEQCSAWSIKDSAFSFSCDDSGLPKAAFPYVIDPVLTPSVDNLQSCRYWTSSGSEISCTPGSFTANTDTRFGASTYDVATWTMDTSSIPANATINSVLVSMITGNLGGTYTVSGDNGVQMATCGPTFYSPMNCDSVAAPTNSITRAAVTNFTGSCPDCNRYFQDPPPPYYSSPATLSSFSLTVNYTAAASYYTLTTSASPAGSGGVGLNPSGGSYSGGQIVTLAATPNAGYVFSSWTGNVANTFANPTTITMNGSQNVTANFAVGYVLTTSVSPSPSGGTVTAMPAGGIYATGTVVSLTATPSQGYRFVSWTGPVASASSANTTVTMS
ncbi:MAG: hypothetical protein HY040_26280 [Planctomycetes bacterium]|nr:hypothetical protein [Planctomycetota bacterium]